MTKKEKMDLLLAKVPEERKAAFVEELRETKTMEEVQALFKKYNISLTEEEREAVEHWTNKVSDEELELVAGGCYPTSDHILRVPICGA